MKFSKSPHRFDTGFIPTADPARDNITVARNSPLISGVQRKRPGEYLIHMGSFIARHHQGYLCRDIFEAFRIASFKLTARYDETVDKTGVCVIFRHFRQW